MAGELWVPGEPIAKGRPKVSTIGGNARMYTPKATMDAEARVAALWTHEMIPSGVPVGVGVAAFRGRPRGHYRKSGGLSASGMRNQTPIKRPDLDNIVKLILDALNGVAFYDDSQVVKIVATSCWSGSPETSGTFIEVWEIDHA